MSHFPCLVIGENFREQLAPFHEYEVTDRDDQYVIDVDITEEIRKEFETETRKVFVRGSEVVCAHDDRFYRVPTEEEDAKMGGLWGTCGTWNGLSYWSKDWGDGRGYAPRVQFQPEGWIEERRRIAEGKSFLQFVQREISDDSYLRYEVVDSDKVTVFRHTNPNAKWDSYVVGGRWRGFFPRKREWMPVYGGEDRASQVYLKDIDFERAVKEATNAAARVFDVWHAHVLKFGRPRSWKAILDEYGEGRIAEARKAYASQPCIFEYKERDQISPFSEPVTDIGFSKKDYIAKRCKSVLVPFAVVKDKIWHARGEMGWFGVVHNERETDWDAEIWSLYRDLPEDTLLTLVDCHT